MSFTRLFLLSFLLLPSLVSGAVLSVVTVPTYRYLTDSPWYPAVVAGDALKKVPFDSPGGTYYENATTLPDGLGVHDNFEGDDFDQMSPFVQVDYDEVVLGSNSEADGFGIYPSSHLTSAFNLANGRNELPMTFIATEDGKYPIWLGFAGGVVGPSANLQIIGVDGSIENIDLYGVLNALPPTSPRSYPFVGFIFDRPIKSAVIQTGALIDHLQYGYGASPIPESGAAMLAGVAGLLLARRRRTNHC